MSRSRFIRSVVMIFLILVARAAAQDCYTVLHSFNGDIDGAHPYALILGPNGSLFGTTASSLEHPSGGTVFRLESNQDGSWMHTVLHTFNYIDGDEPFGLVLDEAGNLYGTTYQGGNPDAYCSSSCGLVFKLTPTESGSWTETVLHDFTGLEDGAAPAVDAYLLRDIDGNLYSTTQGGGIDHHGVAFRLSPNADGTWTESVLHAFTGGADGSLFKGVSGSLAFDVAGSLYGTAWMGGSYGHGVVFKLVPNDDGTWTENVLHAFTGGDDGRGPLRSLILSKGRNVYGVAGGGAYQSGLFFELSLNSHKTWSEAVLYSFPDVNDFLPAPRRVLFERPGILDVLTSFEIYQLRRNSDGSWLRTLIYAFTGEQASDEPSELIIDAAGNLYGTTQFGGDYGYGTVYKITRSQPNLCDPEENAK